MAELATINLGGSKVGKMRPTRKVASKPRAATAKGASAARGELLAVESRYRRLLHSVSGYVYSVAVQNGRAVSTTHGPGCLAVTGFAPEDYASDDFLWYRMIHPEDRRIVEDAVARVLSGGAVAPLEHRILHRDGSLRWIRHTIVPHVGPAGELVGYDGLIEDVSERKKAEEELRALSERLEALIRVSPLAITFLDVNENVQVWNPAAVSILGWKADEVIGKPNPIVPIEKREEYATWSREVLAGHSMPNLESVRRRKDGSLFNVSLWSAPIHDASGKTIGRMGILADITERKRAEEALRQSEEHFRALVESSPMGIGMSSQNQILYANQTLLDILGYATLAELTAVPLTDLVAPESAELIKERFQALSQGKPLPADFEYTIIRKDGRKRIVHAASSHLMSQGTLLTQTTFQDLTDRRKAEEALRNSEERFRRMFQQSSAGMVLVDPGFRFIQANPAFCSMLGYTEAELLTKTFQDVTYPEDRPVGSDLTREVLAGEIEGFQLEKRYVHRSGRIVFGLVSSGLIRDAKGSPLYFVTQVLDISERKRAQAERDQLEGKLQEAQRLEAVGLLAGGIAHDFNNMLAIIMGYAETLQGELPSDSPAQAEIAEIVKAAVRSSELTRQLLAFARRQTLSVKPIDLNRVVLDIQSMLRRSLREDIAVELRLSPSPCTMTGDQGYIGQVLLNLALNAQYAMPKGGTLIIETSEILFDEDYATKHTDVSPGFHVMLSVSDTGTGMETETMRRLFEPFFTTKPLGEGTGLGLPMVYGIVKQHGGTIDVQSEPGKGSTFRIYFPKCGEPAQTAGSGLSLAPSRGTETVLVVEDQDELRKLVCRTLSSLGYGVLEAKDGIAALELAEGYAGAIDLVVTDVIMQGINGKGLYERLSQRPTGIKVLFMSGYSGSVITQYGIGDHEIDFISKPFSSQALASSVREVLDRKNPLP